MRKTVWILAAFAVSATLYGGLWYATATTVRTLTLQWLDDRRREGLVVTHDAPALDGFPLRAEIDFPNLAIAAPALAESPTWSWHMETLRVFARPLVFDRVFLDLSGAHKISGFSAQDIHADVKQADAVVTTAGDTAALTVAGLTAGALTLEKAHLTTTFAANAIHTEIALTNATLPDILPPPLSRTLASLKLSLDITGPVTTGARLPAVLEGWRAGGGTMEVRALDVDWPPVSATGSGTVSLDKYLQPEGAFTATFRGFLEVVDMLATAGRMDNQQASLARGALVLLSKTPREGGAAYLDLSLTVQNRKVYAGPLTLMEMPPIAWRQNVIVP
jgi:hypothetical protein